MTKKKIKYEIAGLCHNDEAANEAVERIWALFSVVGQSEHCKHNQEDLIRDNSAGWKCKCGKEVTYF